MITKKQNKINVFDICKQRTEEFFNGELFQKEKEKTLGMQRSGKAKKMAALIDRTSDPHNRKILAEIFSLAIDEKIILPSTIPSPEPARIKEFPNFVVVVPVDKTDNGHDYTLGKPCIPKFHIRHDGTEGNNMTQTISLFRKPTDEEIMSIIKYI
jgi:hypothetical protein